MARFTFKLEISVDQDRVPGWGNDPEDFINLIVRSLEGVRHYNPKVVISEKISYDHNGKVWPMVVLEANLNNKDIITVQIK